MGWNDLLLRLRALGNRRRAESEMDEELSFHLEMEARKKRLAGMDDAQARRYARVAFGGVDQVRDQCRDIRGFLFLENLARDFRYGVRMLLKAPVFAAVAVFSLAVGIGANSAVFSLLDTVLLRMLPVRNPEELVVMRWGAHKDLDLSFTWASGSSDAHGWTRNGFSWPAFAQLRAEGRAVRDVIGFSPLGALNVASGEQALSTGGLLVSGNYYSALGVRTVLGRPIQDDDDMASGFTAAVISYRFWERMFGLSPAALGQVLMVNGQPCTVIGVTPREFFGVSNGGFMFTPEVDITLPIRARERVEGSESKHIAWMGNEWHWIQMMGRVAPGREQAAKGELGAIVMANLPEAARRAMAGDAPRILLDPGSRGLDMVRQRYRRPLLVLMAVVGLTLLMACANLAGLLLARTAARQREILVRMAVGASRARLVRQLLIEGMILSGTSMAAGLALGEWGMRILRTTLTSAVSPAEVEASLDLRVLGFTAAVSLATTVLFALAPALRATRVDVSTGLKEDTTAAPGRRRFGATGVLLAAQVAVAVVLLAGAALLTRSLANLRSISLGFNAHSLVLFDLAPGKSGYDEIRGNQIYTRVLERLQQTSGVTGATLSRLRLITGAMSNGSVQVEGGASRRDVRSTFNFVGPGFAEVMGIPVVLGRGIELRDMKSTPRVAVINETLAHNAFGEASPLGRRFRWWSKKEDVEIVGVVKDARYDRLREEPPATIYAPYTQCPFGWPQQMSFAVRTAGSTAEAIPAIRRAVGEVDRRLPVVDVKTQEEQIDQALVQERLFAFLVSLFGAITLVLACVGLYGLVSYSVTSRTREIGIRMALGACRSEVLRMLLGQVAVAAATGLAVGVPATWALTRVIESQLFGIPPHDPLSLAGAMGLVIAVAVIAALLPARRAMHIDPVRALRYE